MSIMNVAYFKVSLVLTMLISLIWVLHAGMDSFWKYLFVPVIPAYILFNIYSYLIPSSKVPIIALAIVLLTMIPIVVKIIGPPSTSTDASFFEAMIIFFHYFIGGFGILAFIIQKLQGKH